ncbi:hypothetical protein IJH74_01845 [Candidatus Saccharibacteria bacterium]|nr:hypothetical protein [Candidatus Saccharibacteria bacterium]
MNMKRRMIIISFFVLISAITIAIVFIFSQKQHPVELDQEYYSDEVEAVDIDKSEYEKLITDRKSFVLMVDNPGCTTTEKMRRMLENLELNFKYYRIMWQDARETNLKDYIKYFPSIVIIKKGRVVSYLRADSDEDTKYYNNGPDLKDWLEAHVKF